MMSHDDMTWTSGLIPMIEPDMVSEIISRVADLALVISSAGVVLGVLSNPNFKLRLGFSRWEGQALNTLLTVESVSKFNERLTSFLNSPEGVVRPVELNHIAMEEQAEFPIRYTFHRVGSDGAILMLGQDLRPIAEMQQQLVAAQIALEKDYEAQREYDTRLRVLMSSMPEGALFVSVSTGIVADFNAAALALFGVERSEMVGIRLPEILDTEGDAGILNTLARVAGGQAGNEMTTKTRGGRVLSIKPTLFRTKGEQMMLCQITDSDGAQVRSDSLTEHLGGLFERGADGIIFVTKEGTILSANDAFLQISDAINPQAVRGRSISDFLIRGSVDMNVMSENALRTGAMRLYATRIIGEHGAETPVEIATSLLNTGKDPVFALVIRDASRAERVRNTSQQLTDVDMRSVIELIGNQTLKGIVAKTTDVIEKMCIETAVELTSNNRVAAAEMLGLSRQSLYVKLRKYDLLKKDMEE